MSRNIKPLLLFALAFLAACAGENPAGPMAASDIRTSRFAPGGPPRTGPHLLQPGETPADAGETAA